MATIARVSSCEYGTINALRKGNCDIGTHHNLRPGTCEFEFLGRTDGSLLGLKPEAISVICEKRKRDQERTVWPNPEGQAVYAVPRCRSDIDDYSA